jgi:hypothetical protein
MRIPARASRNRAIRAMRWLVAMVVLAAVPQSAGADDFVVGPGQLQGVLDSAKPGDRIFLNPGVYSAGIVVRRGGQPGVPITITRATATTPVLTGRWQIRAPYVTVSRLVFDGMAYNDYPIWVTGSGGVYGSHFTLDYSEIRDSRISGLFVGETSPPMPVDGVAIRHSYFHDNGGSPSQDHGIYIKSGSNHLIEGNLIVRSSGFGIQNYPHAQGVVIRGNEVRDNGGGILIEHDAGDELPMVNHTLVEGNYLKSNRGMGITLHYGSDPSTVPPGITNTVQGNWAAGNAGGQYGSDGVLGNSDYTRGAVWSGNVYGDPPGGVLVPLSSVGPNAATAAAVTPAPAPGTAVAGCAVLSRSTRMSRKGVVGVRVVCPTAQRGVLRLRAARGRRPSRRKRRTLVLGSKSFSVSAGRSRVRIKLAAAGRRLVLRRKRVSARAAITSPSVAASGGNSWTVRIRAPHARHKRR